MRSTGREKRKEVQPVERMDAMKRKTKVQAMPGKKAAGVSKDTQINPGKASPKGARAEQPSRANQSPRSGPRGNEGNNTRRDFVGGPRGVGKSRSR